MIKIDKTNDDVDKIFPISSHRYMPPLVAAAGKVAGFIISIFPPRPVAVYVLRQSCVGAGAQ